MIDLVLTPDLFLLQHLLNFRHGVIYSIIAKVEDLGSELDGVEVEMLR